MAHTHIIDTKIKNDFVKRNNTYKMDNIFIINIRRKSYNPFRVGLDESFNSPCVLKEQNNDFKILELLFPAILHAGCGPSLPDTFKYRLYDNGRLDVWCPYNNGWITSNKHIHITIDPVQKTCPICFNEYDHISLNECGHHCCYECATTWNKDTCITCRKYLDHARINIK